ncbi:MAG: GatB/YqeY domain-containing protein [Planctomycetes bacterium]|nr:GatB/YqeY domain-containing protein [Planctomycetota bacterium]
MAAYLDRLTADMKAAMKAGDKTCLEVVRMLISEIKKRAEAADGNLTDDDEGAILQKAVKMRADTVAQARAAGRDEIADREQSEIDIIQTYLPQQMSADEITARVREVATEIGYASPKDTGKFMKAWMTRYKGLADGKLVQAALQGLEY